ncbi:MAG: TlpA family protein disulfide reductase [Chloroflexi bacterium]|nr:TlpA family protein disulfide reductase [Chloroflexota bacterium]
MTDMDLLQQMQDESPEAAGPRKGLGAGPIFILAAVVVFVAVVGVALARQNAPQPTSGEAPDFTINTFAGQNFRLSDFRGQPVVINFWASWCAPCHDEAPALQALWERYEGRVMFIGITHADEPDDSRAFMERYGITYPTPKTRATT